ncbi:unnamed protein product, partial [Ectocarpus sp. 12 AP-2014]
ALDVRCGATADMRRNCDRLVIWGDLVGQVVWSPTQPVFVSPSLSLPWNLTTPPTRHRCPGEAVKMDGVGPPASTLESARTPPPARSFSPFFGSTTPRALRPATAADTLL